MKAILISKPPKIVANVLNDLASILIFKTCPKDWKDYLSGKTKETPKPTDVYIYCTKEEYLYRTNKGYFSSKKPLEVGKGTEYSFAYSDEGKVVAKFTLNKVEQLRRKPTKDAMGGWKIDSVSMRELLTKSCLFSSEISNYLNGKRGYALHISNLVIFDKPKELSEFSGIRPNGLTYMLEKAPQSFMFIETEN